MRSGSTPSRRSSTSICAAISRATSGASPSLAKRDLVRKPGRAREPALVGADLHVVDARLAAAHQTVVRELPELVAVGPEPASGSIVPLVLETNGDPAVRECPERLAQPVVELSFPLTL